MSRTYVLERRQVVPFELERAFAFFAEARNLERITPPWLRFEILDAPECLKRGAILRYRLRLYGVPVRWRTEIVEWTPPRGFVDLQRRGPYLLWEHAHRLRAVAGGTEIYDHVRYRLFGEPLAAAVHPLVRRSLDEIFDYRAERVVTEMRRARVERPRRTG